MSASNGEQFVELCEVVAAEADERTLLHWRFVSPIQVWAGNTGITRDYDGRR
jgi:hypothetical protein